MGWACSAGETTNVYKILFESLEGGDHSEVIGMDGAMTFRWIVWEGLACVCVDQDRDQRRTLVDKIKKLQTPQKEVIS
jgi:hypothetical protein